MKTRYETLHAMITGFGLGVLSFAGSSFVCATERPDPLFAAIALFGCFVCASGIFLEHRRRVHEMLSSESDYLRFYHAGFRRDPVPDGATQYLIDGYNQGLSDRNNGGAGREYARNPRESYA